MHDCLKNELESIESLSPGGFGVYCYRFVLKEQELFVAGAGPYSVANSPLATVTRDETRTRKGLLLRLRIGERLEFDKPLLRSYTLAS